MNDLGISKETINLVEECEEELEELFKVHEDIAQYNQHKVLQAFRNNEVALRHFSASSGYGYEDESKLKLDSVYASAFGCEDAIVRPQIVSGTHCLSICLFGLLRPGDTMLCATGTPYDTIQKTIGIKEAKGSLKEWGIGYSQVDLIDNEEIDIRKITSMLANDTDIRLVYFQRSRGYANRKTIDIDTMARAFKEIKKINEDVIILVDNCYGEFVEKKEPTDVGADIIAGSLIKNPGGGIAPTGGYIAGRKKCIDLIADRFSAPGLGKETCSYNAVYTNFFQGFFLAPHIVLQSIKGAILMAKAYEKAGYKARPRATASRSDLIQSIEFNTEEELIEFCKGIQKAAPVDSFVIPEPWDMPGYSDKIIMASGSFIQGSSIEFSADAPIKKPYIAFAQGGLTYEHIKLGIMYSLDEMSKFKNA